MLAHGHGSRFNGPATGTLHAQQRGAPPPKYLNRSVRIGVFTVPAGDARKHRLALAGSGVDGTAGRAGLRTVGCWNSDYLSAAFLHFVAENGRELVPSGVQDRTVKARFLSDVAAGRPHAAGSRSSHVSGLKVFQHDYAEPLGNVDGSAMVEVTPDARLPSLETRDTGLSFAPPVRTALAPSNDPLCLALLGFNLVQARRHAHHLASRESKRRSHTPINTYCINARCGSFMLKLASERDMPSEGVKANCGVLERAAHRPRISELHPTDLRQPHSGPLIVQRANGDLAPLEPEAIVDALATRRRVGRSTTEERNISFVQVTQGLLKAGSLYGRNPRKLATYFGNLRRLRSEGYAFTCRSLIVTPPIAPLLQRDIVNMPACSGELPEQEILFRLRSEAKPISPASLHEADFSTAGLSQQILLTQEVRHG